MPASHTPQTKPCKRGHLAGRYTNGTCKECQRAAQRQSEKSKNCKRLYFINNPKQMMLNAARERAKAGGYSCTITTADIVIPDRCPLLDIKLQHSRGSGTVQHGSPSLDKIKPELGYVPGNVWVISHRANQIKNDASLAELITLVERLKRVLS